MNTIGLICFFLIAFMMGGCTTVSQDEVFDGVRMEVSSRGGENLAWIKTDQDEAQIQERIDTILKSPLSQEDAVKIALINNRSLQMMYEEIGLSYSDLVQAGLMSNPLLGYSVGRGGGKTTSTWSVDVAFLDLLWIPLRRSLGEIALEETKYRVGNEVLSISRDVKKSYIDARVAEEQVRMYQSLLQSYEASYQLAIRQYTAGNLSKRDYLKIKDDYTRARIEAIGLNRASGIAQEALNRLLGLSGEQTYYQLETKPLELTAIQIKEQGLENRAITHRLDMASVIKAVDYAAKEAGYTQNTRLLSEGEISAQSEKTTDESRFRIVGIKIPIPIFDFGQGRLSQVQAKYNQKVHHLYQTAVDIRSQVREGYASYRYRYDVAKEYNEVVIQNNQQILEETQRFYNGMLDGIDHLLEAQRRVVEVRMEALHASGEAHKAYADLEYTIGGTL